MPPSLFMPPVCYETFDAETEHSAAAQQAGWQSILDNFKRYVEAAG